MTPTTKASSAELPSDSLVPPESILCTEELNRRPLRPPDYQMGIPRSAFGVQDPVVEDQQASLPRLIAAQRVAELQRANADAEEARRAALRTTDEVVQSQNHVDTLNMVPAHIHTALPDGGIDFLNQLKLFVSAPE